jgi:para-nitrobenzyl esterase
MTVMTKFRALAACASLALIGAHAAAVAKTAPATPALVQTDAGPVEGKRLDSGVTAFLGIPYAAPPVRELRWKDPKPAPPWKSTLHADRFGPQCMQPQRGLLTNQYSGAEVTSEDCLYLNVWTKPGLRKAPVIVYIHGGGFFIGSAGMPLYGGEAVSREGAVFVNFNYRLGALGFMAHPALSAESPHKTSGNYGLLDQIAALKWVKANVAKFGGDPDNVTIAGQSAGSMSVLTLQASPLTKGLIHRAVGMSGGLGAGPGATPTLAEAEAEGVKLQKYLKAESLEQLRALPADRILVPRIPDGPRVSANQGGYLLPEATETIFAKGMQNDVPLMLGFAHDESFGGFGEVKGLDDYRAKATARFGDRAAAFLDLYPASTDAEAKAQARAADRDSTMASSMAHWAEAQLKHSRNKVYTYQFSRPHSYAAGVKFTDLDPATAGSYHTSEVPFWLGTLDSFNRYRTTRAWTAADRAFSLEMTRSLVAFARTGNPDTAGIKWPAYEPKSPMLIDLGATARTSPWPDRRKFKFFADTPRPNMAGGALRD